MDIANTGGCYSRMTTAVLRAFRNCGIAIALAAFWQLAGGPLPEAKADTERTLEDLSFLKGNWVGKSSSGAQVEEFWSTPLGDSMIGHCRFVKDGKTTFYELLVIVKTPTGIVLRMRHFNDALLGWDEKDEAGDCILVRFAPNEVVFENGKGNHAVKVTYKRTGASLHTLVQDTREGKTSSFPFEYRLSE